MIRFEPKHTGRMLVLSTLALALGAVQAEAPKSEHAGT